MKMTKRCASGDSENISYRQGEYMALNFTSGMEIDVHGMTTLEAEACIDKKLDTVGNNIYRIKVVHGYNRGTAIREMVYDVYKYHDKVKRVSAGDNPGETILVLREY